MVVPSFNPGEDGDVCLGLGLPAASGDELALQAGKEALGHGVVVGIASTVHGGAHTHVLTALAKGQTGVLAALVRVVNDGVGFAGVQDHVEGGHDQFGGHVFAKGLAYDLAAVDIEHHAQVREAGPGGDVGHVGHSQLVDIVGHKAALSQVARALAQARTQDGANAFVRRRTNGEGACAGGLEPLWAVSRPKCIKPRQER